MYTSLAEAETALTDAQFGVGATKLEVIKIVGHIRSSELYLDAENPRTGKQVKSLDEYLKLKSEELKRVSGMGGRHILRNLKAYLAFCDTLDFPEDWFLGMGEHALVLSEAANMGHDLTLRGENAPSSYGGRLLGSGELRDQALELSQMIEDEDTAWKVRDTRVLVNSILGKTAPSTAEWVAQVTTEFEGEATRVVILKMQWIFDTKVTEFTCGQRWTLEDFHAFAEREHIRVEGLDGGDFAQTHMH